MQSIVSALLLGALMAPAQAQEPIRMARTPDISPDGKLVAFSYLGDIWVVDAIGGIARPVTTHRAHDINPVFSPDGKSIAFSSTRHGSYDVFVIPTQSGKPRRLTYDSASDMVCDWSPDGKQVLFSSNRTPDFPSNTELYTVPVEGGRVQRITRAEGKDGVFSPVGDRLAYVRGPGQWYRKGYHGSANDDVWVCNLDGQNNQRVTRYNGQDGSPMWSPDGKTLYYVSDELNRVANIVKVSFGAGIDPEKTRPTAVTRHTDEAVRKARISRDGKWIVYECGPDLWITGTGDGASPRKLAIEVHTDDKSNTERMETFTANATEFTLSPDERHMVFAVHGELFLMATTPGARTRRLTTSNVNNHGASWAPDGSAIVFVSDRDGHENVYKLEAADPVGAKLTQAVSYKTTQLTSSTEACIGVGYSPDGKKLAFIRSGKLWTMNPDGKEAKQLIPDGTVFDYEWAPDSKWICYARQDPSFASELYLIPAEGPTKENPARNITRYATYNGGVTWSGTGTTLAFLSTRKGADNSSVYTLALRKPTGPGIVAPESGTPPTVEIDWDDIANRTQQVLPLPVEAAAISPSGNQIAIRMASPGSERGSDLWLVNSNGSQLTRLTTGSQQPQNIQWSRRNFGAPTIYFRDNNGNIKLARPSLDPKGEPTIVTLLFSVKMTIKAEEEFQEMFDQAWRILSENFYDPKFHGADWDAVRARYRPLVKHIAMKEDLFALLYLMMGELNASHLGISNTLSTPEEPTADLGLILDPFYNGKGLKVLDILKRGPADQRGVNISPGSYVMAIDGTPIRENTNIAQLLNGKGGQTVILQVAANPEVEPKTWRRVEIQATSRDGTGLNAVRELYYDRWVEQNARKVADLSGGKLGYIHIPSMNEAGLDRFVRALYSDNFDKEGIVLDVRFNGGGFTHDRVMNYLNAREHTLFRQRDGAEGLVLRSGDRKWTRPVTLLINNRSYSDAEIFPSAFRTLGVGKLVGEPTGGHVIGTRQTQLIDGSTFRIPRIGVFTVTGVNMDREGVKPDILIEPHPDQLGKGEDPQLKAAVEALRRDVDEWKKKRGDKVE
jgi:tricorn protease